MPDLRWVTFWEIFYEIGRSYISGTWLFDFSTLEGLAKGLVLCSIINMDLRRILEEIKLYLNPHKELLDLLIPGNTCYGTTWHTTKDEKLERIKSLGIKKSYEDELSRTKNVSADQTALLEVKEALEEYKNISLKWKKDEGNELDHMRKHRTLLFGGPVSNIYSEQLLKEFPLLNFNLQSPNYELIVGEERYEPDYDKNKRTYLSDYGVIVFKKYASFAPNGVIAFMGCHGYGTLAAAKVLTDHELSGVKKVAREVVRKLRAEHDFYVILEVEVDRGVIEKVNFVKAGP